MIYDKMSVFRSETVRNFYGRVFKKLKKKL